MVQVPTAVMLTRPLEELTAHTETVDVTYATARAELTLAPARNAGSPKSFPAIAGKDSVWLIFPATIVCVTDTPAATFVVPAWLAVITHVPEVTNVTTAPTMPQTPGEPDVMASVTLNPEVEVAAGV